MPRIDPFPVSPLLHLLDFIPTISTLTIATTYSSPQVSPINSLCTPIDPHYCLYEGKGPGAGGGAESDGVGVEEGVFFSFFSKLYIAGYHST